MRHGNFYLQDAFLVNNGKLNKLDSDVSRNCNRNAMAATEFMHSSEEVTAIRQKGKKLFS